jgi:predicted dehydrogenase
VEPVRCAVIGVGMMGASHVGVLNGLTSANLIGCCDVDSKSRSRVPEGVRFYENLEDLVARPELEAVFVCTPQDVHLPVINRCLQAGVAVFCEKPLAHDLASADRIIAAAAQSDSLLVVGHTMRFDPNYLEIVAAVAAGEIGEPVHLTARRNVPAFEGHMLARRTNLPVEVGIHDIDILRWIGGDITRVYAEPARTASLGEGAVDAVIGTLRFASGAVGIVEFNWVMKSETGLAGDYRLSVFGTEGAAYLEMRDPAATVFTQKGVRLLRTSGQADVHGTVSGILANEDRHFLATVRGSGIGQSRLRTRALPSRSHWHSKSQRIVESRSRWAARTFETEGAVNGLCSESAGRRGVPDQGS